jgi:two-component system, cell cycle sensor histidine kinase and response regulator CckA
MLPESNAVLVVEDEPNVRALVQDVLSGEGYTVLDARDPWEALGVAESYPIRLLVTDVVMPEMNGCELARRIESFRPATKVLFMSASAIDDLLDPDAHFIAKPFPLHRILDTVSHVLSEDAGAEAYR